MSVFDTLVVCVTGTNGGRPVDQVFLAHSSGSVLRVNVWEGLKVKLWSMCWLLFVTVDTGL